MYSLLQVSTIYELAEEFPLPETTFEGATILNNLEVDNYINLKDTYITTLLFWIYQPCR